MGTWKDKAAFLKSSGVTHTVNGQELRFYPVNVNLVFRFKDLAGPLAQSLTVLFSSASQDHRVEQRTFGKGDKETTEFISEASDVGVLGFTYQQREKAIERLITALGSDENRQLLADVMMDSLPDVFPPADSSERPSAEDFYQSVPGEVATAMLLGVAKANKGVFGPLASSLGDGLQRKMASVQARAEAWETGQETATDGSGSEKTPSGSEAEDTTSPGS